MANAHEIIEKGDKDHTLSQIADAGYATKENLVREQLQSALLVQCTKDLEKSIGKISASLDAAASASDRLGRRVFVLDVVLGILTLIGLYFTISSFFRPQTAVFG